MKTELILASSSKRRQELLSLVGISYKVVESDISEEFPQDQRIEDGVVTLACKKAVSIESRFPESWILAADTMVALGEAIFQKPRDQGEARAMLKRLNGRAHEVFTGYCLRNKVLNRLLTGVARTVVRMKTLRDEEIERYVQTGEPLDKAGGYGIQGIGAMLVEGIYGSYTNVVGLPLAEIVDLLSREGIAAPLGGR